MIVRVQIAGQELNPITIAPYIKGEKGDKGDPGDSAVAISTDPNNAATLGSDGKIFVPAQSGVVDGKSVVLAVVGSIAFNLD